MKVAVCAALLLLAVMTPAASAATCDLSQLSPCAPALFNGAAATASCCSSLRAQQSCFCQYAKNPAYARYISSPNARKIISSCGLSVPRC
ncbi:hypothetical protein U9M48_005848 [Paspalum notatum var. saurae]|uniref:Bifunctional inhibitor/plant lipid transfer protein/seed storage helical domain-containing protein n=1 Tax=Paspalum notatum var. saurae TaxID=547442 RepID=A0AAQ3SFQ7_PASNO